MLVRVPVEVVKDWNIKAEDQIETDISWVGSDVSVKIFKNGEAVTDIPGATVEIPYANRDSQTMLTDEEGNSYTGSVNDEQNAAVIPIDKTGDYTVEEQPQNQTENGGNTEEDNPEGDSLENAADSGEEKLSEQVEELLSEDVKNQKANSDENLNSQHKKNGFNCYNNCNFVNIVMEYTNETQQKSSERGNGVKENKAKKKEGSCCGEL